MLNNYIPNFLILNFLGSGTFGTVLECYDTLNDQKVAIKRIHKNGLKISREFLILKEINDNDYIIKLLDSFYTVNFKEEMILNLVLEYIPITLDYYIDENKLRGRSIPIDIIKKFMKQILLGINYIHNKNIVHRDIKPNNILLTENFDIKISDFGAAKKLDKISVSTPYVVNTYYRAPELIIGEIKYDYKIDIWSIGCIFFELFTLKILFKGENDTLQFFDYINLLGNPDEGFYEHSNLPDNIIKDLKNLNSFKSKDLFYYLNEKKKYDENIIKLAADLISKMICWDPKKRISAIDCLNHDFFK